MTMNDNAHTLYLSKNRKVPSILRNRNTYQTFRKVKTNFTFLFPPKNDKSQKDFVEIVSLTHKTNLLKNKETCKYQPQATVLTHIT
jgi:hypothetical protein